jgi:uncharacterized protein YndB with AHSA1/START domain
VPAAPRETSVVEYEVRVAARPETVFAYFTDPIKMVQWMGAEATLDPRPGGVCRIAFQAPQSRAEFVAASFGAQREEASEPLELSGSGVMMGEFVEVDPYQRIVLTWGWEQELPATPPQSTLVEISFSPDGEDTMLQVAQRRLPAASALTSIELVGNTTLTRLAIAAACDDPGTGIV